MNEQLKNLKNKIMDAVNKVDVLKKLVEMIKANRTVVAIAVFCVVAIGMMLTSVFALQEFVVSICILIVIEVAMAALLHGAELWKHGVLLLAQIVVAVVIKRIPLVALCVIVYVTATAAISLMKVKSVTQS